MLARREFLLEASSLGALVVQFGRPSEAGGAVDPRAHGAVGDGVVDDTRAVEQALAFAFDHNRPVEGGSAVFAVSRNIPVLNRSNPWIRSLRLKQLAPANDRKTLYFRNCQGIRIERLQIDVGRSRSVGYMNDSGGLWIDGGSGHDVREVEVFGHGKNSLIAIWNTNRSTYAKFRARDAEYDAPGVKDDVTQGIFLLRNSDCTLRSPKVSSLSGNAEHAFPTRYTRGIVLGGNTRLTIVEADVSDVDQGIDITGSDGNRGCQVLGAHCYQCNSVGVKLANSAVECRVVDSLAERCGLVGFFASGPSEGGLPYKTQECEFVRCTAIDIGYNGFSDSAPRAGFRIERNRFDQEYPMGIRMIDCRAVDRQRFKTMEYGFYADVRNGAGTLKPNRLIGCRSEGHTKGIEFGPWG